MSRILLIVDDILINRQILKERLSADYDILEAASDEEALDILSRQYASISAVLLDISLPGIDGFEVLCRIRSNKALSYMPVIMIMGSKDEEGNFADRTAEYAAKCITEYWLLSCRLFQVINQTAKYFPY